MAFGDYLNRTEAAAELPRQLVDELIAAVQKESVVLSLGRQVPTTTRDSRVPVVSRLPSASWITGADPDAGLKSVSDMAITNQELIAEELATIAVIPQNVVDDSGFPLWDAVRPELASAISRAYDEAVLFGVNAPTTFPPGLVQQASTAGNVVSGDLYADDTDNPKLVLQAAQLVSQMGYSPTGAAVAPGWQYRASALRTSALVANPVGATSPFPMVLGGLGIRTDPLIWIPPAASSPDAIIADWRLVLVGMRKEITLEAFNTGVISDATGKVVQNLLQQDLVAVRVTFRAGFYLAAPPTGYPVATPCPVGVVENSGTVFAPHVEGARAAARHEAKKLPGGPGASELLLARVRP
jgi:hypothetical protein